MTKAEKYNMEAKMYSKMNEVVGVQKIPYLTASIRQAKRLGRTVVEVKPPFNVSETIFEYFRENGFTIDYVENSNNQVIRISWEEV